MKNFADRLIESIDRLNNPTVMGLDAAIDRLPVYLLKKSDRKAASPADAAARTILDFNMSLIDAVADIIPAVKLQSAYYELYGSFGVRALADTAAYARKKGMIVIADGKRNDIGSTAEAYATAYLGKTSFSNGICASMFDVDALTINAYLGYDGVEPFIRQCEKEGKGIYILVRTSNSSAGDFQDLLSESGKPIYVHVADKVAEWGRSLTGRSGYSSVGAVVGATWPEQALMLRDRMDGVPFLVPGYGAQGASALDVCAGFDRQGRGAIVNASRSLMYAFRQRKDYREDQFDLACRDEALRMRDELRASLVAVGKIPDKNSDY